LTRAALARAGELRLVDRAWPEHGADAADGAVRVTADLADPAEAVRAIAGADVLVHLAGDPRPDQTGTQALANVAQLAVTVAEAAARAGIPRVIHASSVHACGGYLAESGVRPISTDLPARPCCEYGAAKVFAENAFALLHRRTGASVIALRLGLVGFPPFSPELARQWLGDEDYGRSIRAALTAPAGDEVVLALSRGAEGEWELAGMRTVLDMDPAQIPPPVDRDRRAQPPHRPRLLGHCTMFDHLHTEGAGGDR
jgi:nucleoside-diphosphate-sugar epimerase